MESEAEIIKSAIAELDNIFDGKASESSYVIVEFTFDGNKARIINAVECKFDYHKSYKE